MVATSLSSITHSSRITIARNSTATATSGIIAIFVSPSIVQQTNNCVTENENNDGNINTATAVVSESSQLTNEGISIIGNNSASEAYSIDDPVFRIQISMIHPDSNLLVTYATTQYTLKQIASDLSTMTTISNDKNISRSSNSSDGRISDQMEALQKLTHLLSLLKETTTATTTSSEVKAGKESTLLSSTNMLLKNFIVIELTQQTLKEGKVKSALKLSVKERMPNTMVRIIWSTILSSVDDDDGDNATKADRIHSINDQRSSSASELLDLSFRLTEQQQEMAQQLKMVHEQYQLLLRDRDGWKDTAQQLEGQWEKEKLILFQNFCTLYTSKQDHDQSIIRRLQEDIEQLKVNVSKPDPRDGMQQIKSELPECLQDVPDDHGIAFNDEVVRRLARGERVPMKAIKTEDDDDKPEPTTSTSATVRQKRHRSPMSGTTEYMDPDDALKDILEPPADNIVPLEQPIPTVTKKSRTDIKKEKQEKKKEAKPIKTAPTKKNGNNLPPPPNTDDNSSATGSDDDFVDKSMEAQIMADLQALRK